MTLEAIKEAIVQLPEEERLALESWMAKAWDAQIEQDFSPGGAGLALLEEVDAQIEAANTGLFKVTRPRG